uniref:NADH-ubiquinone oxidoreductase chain 2 n=1 Tax=Neotetracus sinensis TaxID=977878 RepID=H6TDD5_9EUTH|nr:NADH dehydrogenase subunit 2 [Neotetracus sinensis]
MNPLTFSIIIFMILAGTMIVVFSSHWLLTWIGFEMNMLAMIPLLMFTKNPRSTEAAVKYFMMQASASMILLFAIIMNFSLSNQWTVMNMLNYFPSTLLTISMLMKLGMAPFHFWVPEVTQGIPLKMGMVLLTWQKLAPMFILYQSIQTSNNQLIMISSLLSISIGGWGGLNQLQLRKILAYSSIAHMGWMLMIMKYNPTLSLFNLSIYIIITLTMIILLTPYNITSTSQLSQMWNTNFTISSIVLLTLMSLGGLPPLSGFAPKWLIIQEMTKNNNIILPTIMAIMALLNLMFYMRIIYASSMTLFPSTSQSKMKWMHKNQKPLMFLPPLISLSILFLPLTPMYIIYH